MCGIAGFIDFKQSSSKEVLKTMTDTMTHRGPNASGLNFFVHTTFQVGLGHRRLSIIDLSDGGAQPMTFEHLSITYNGEIYNFKEIRAELLLLNHSFAGQSDTEVILQAFAQWGIACIEKFTGMFAFVIYDSKSEKVYCVRDRAGVKPFYYYWDGQLFLFASELKAFHKHPLFKKEINPDALAAFLQFGNVPTPHCIFKNCSKLKPGHSLTFNLSDAKLKIDCYWNVYNAYNVPKLEIGFEEATKETEQILKKAFQYRLVSDVPLGIFLSGGYDSACLAALLQKNTSEKLKTFTISVPDIGLNEAPYAKEVAAYLGTEHFEFSCTQKEALDLITNLPYYYDEPFADSSAIPTTLVCKMAREQVTVALSADGGDEVFAGYNRYDYLMKHGKNIASLSNFSRKGLAGLMNMLPADKIPILKNKYNFSNRYEKLKGLLQDPSSKNLMLSLSKQYTDLQLKALLKYDFQELETAYYSEELMEASYSPLAYMMAIDYQTYLNDDILQKVDRASMSQSLEAREPFLDHHIIEWAARLPDEYKYHNGVKKRILKEIVHQHIPKKIMDRPKMGFAIPIENWLTYDLKHQVQFYLNETRIREQGIFEPETLQKLCSDFFAGKKELTLKIWYLLMFQMWYDTWMK